MNSSVPELSLAGTEKAEWKCAVPVEDVVVSPKTGFGYRHSYGSTAITDVIPSKNIRTADNKSHPEKWDSSTKLPTGNSTIKPFLGTQKIQENLKPKLLRDKPVPRSHYKEPFRPNPTSKKGLQKAKNENFNPGIVIRILQSIVDPILKPDDEKIDEEPVKREVITGSLSPDSETAEPPTSTITHKTDIHPGLASSLWHSVVDPIFHRNQPEINDADEGPEKELYSEESVVFEDSSEFLSQSYPNPTSNLFDRFWSTSLHQHLIPWYNKLRGTSTLREVPYRQCGHDFRTYGSTSFQSRPT